MSVARRVQFQYLGSLTNGTKRNQGDTRLFDVARLPSPSLPLLGLPRSPLARITDLPMHTLSNLRIGQRLSLGFLAIIVLMVILTVVGIQRVRSIDRQLTAINEVNSVKQRYAINFRGSVHDRAIALRDVVLMDAPSDRHAAEQLIDKLAADYARSAQPLDNMIAASTDAREKTILQQIKSIEQRTLPLIAQVRTFRDAADRMHAEQRLLQEARPAFIDWLASINAFIDLQEQKNRQAAKEAVATARGFAMLMVISTVVALLLGAAIALLLTRSVVLPLRLSLQLAERISAGDLSSSDTPRRARTNPASCCVQCSKCSAVCGMSSRRSAPWQPVTTLARSLTAATRGNFQANMRTWCRTPTRWCTRTCRPSYA